MATTGLPALLDEPVWFEPLRRPSWLLAPVHEGAPRVLVRPRGGDPDADLRLGLPLFVGEALRFSTGARVDVATGDWVVTAGSAAVVDAGVVSGEIRVDVTDADGEILEALRIPAGDDRELGAGIASIPSRLISSLSARGVRAVWSTAFRAPSEDRAVGYARSHEALARLRSFTGGPPAEDDADERSRQVLADLHHLTHEAEGHGSPLAVAAFIAGLLVARDIGAPSWGEFRLQANAIAQGAPDPLDPVFRLSIASMMVFGDTGEAASRAARLGRDASEELRTWLVRIGAVGLGR